MRIILLLTITFLVFELRAQEVTIRGIITDGDGEPLIGVTVSVKNTSQGTVTKSDGSYEITLPSNSETLVFSYVGFVTKEITPKEETNLNVSLLTDATSLDEVTVTGFTDLYGRSRKRLESIQSIPESVIALNAEQIEMTGVEDIGTFLTQVPGISYGESQDPGTVLINVRGIPQIRYGHSPIALVVDGVYLADANLNTQTLHDIEQIEVVKGSQGIFYGKNAIGGAVSITTKQITDQLSGTFKAGYGNGNATNSSISLSGPIVKDKVYFRLSSNYANFDGLIENTFLDQYVDFSTDQSIRGLLRFELNDRSNLTVTGHHSYKRSGAITFVDSNHNDDFTGIFTTPFQETVDGDPKAPNNYSGSPRGDWLGEGTINTNFISAKYEISFEKFTLNAISSFTDVSLFYDGDYFSYGPVPDAYQEMERGSETFNQEVRLISKGNSPLQWNAGVFFQRINSPWVTAQINNNDITDYEYTDVTRLNLTDDVNELTSFAPFAFLEYNITDKFKIAAGARNEFETVENTTQLFGGSNSSRSYSVLQPKISASYNIATTFMAYGSYSGGFRSGGYNAAILESPQGGGIEKEIQHETSTSIEAGFKSSFANNRIIFNFAWFSTVFNDQQAYRFGYGNVDGDTDTGDAFGNESFLGTVNLAETELTGFEIDAKIRAFKFLDIIGGYSSIDSEITDAGIIAGFDESANNGNATPFTLESSWNLGLLTKFNLTEKVKIRGNLNVENKGKKFWFAENYLLPQSEVFQEPYTLINSRLMVDFNNITIGIWGRNIANTEYNVEWWPLSAFGNGDIRTPNQPRTYGIDFSYTF
ncbi:MAG: TonB-dependent receptor [Ekhidna sp.]|nr:TonB-dependent receptor [Ekhidna sp.]